MFRVIFWIIYVVVPLFLNRCLAEDAIVNRTDAPPSGQTTTRTITRKWVSEIFDEVRSSFTMSASATEHCRNDYLLYETYLKNQTIWAIRMMESSEWPRLGLFAGATTALGGWSECLSVRAPTYQGQYCLIDAVYDYTFAQAESIARGWDKPANQNSSVWSTIKMYDTIVTRLSRRKLTWALCIPSSCSAGDLRRSLMDAALPIFQKYDLTFETTVAPENCAVEKSKPFSNAFWYTLYFLTSLSAIVLVATYVDDKLHAKLEMKHTNEDERIFAIQAFYAFSIRRSWNYLTHSSPNTIHSLYFAKTFLFCSVLLLHEYIFSVPFPKIEQEKTEMLFQPWTLILAYFSSVDVFLAISGFLRFHFGYEPTKKDGISYFFRSIICRWARLTPVMGVFILFFVFVVPELYDGPLLNKQVLHEIECCKSNWWANMLAVQNMVKRKDLLTIVGAALLVILAKNFPRGVLSIFVIFATGVFAHFYSIYANKFTGLPVPALFELEVLKKLPIVSDLYIQTYSRIGPYMVGFMGAILLRELRIRKYRPSTITSFLLVAGTTFVCIGPQLYGYVLLILNRPYEPIENAVYGTFSRLLVAVPTICFIVLHDLRPTKWLSRILEWKIFLVVGRLAFVLYLGSSPVQYFRYSILRQVIIGSGHIEMIHGIMIDSCLTVIFAGYLFFFVEGPMHDLSTLIEKVILSLQMPAYSGNHNEPILYAGGRNNEKKKTIKDYFSGTYIRMLELVAYVILPLPGQLSSVFRRDPDYKFYNYLFVLD